MTLAETQLADLRKIHEAMGSPMMEWKSDDYPCIPSGAARTKTLGVGGHAIDANLVLKVLKSDFNDGDGPFPNDVGKDLITFRSKTYRAKQDITNESDVFLKIICVYEKAGI